MQTRAIYSTMVLTLLLVNVSGQEGQEIRVRHQRSSNGTVEELEREHRANQQNILRHWSCGSPKPRLVYWSDAIEQPVVNPGHRLLVRATVMHRCETCFGYCPNSTLKCQVTQQDEVTVTFKAVHMNTDTPHYYHVRFFNHTSCGCV